jgi:ubiquinone/menaquinone biosynthesis C-methylase UbiE
MSKKINKLTRWQLDLLACPRCKGALLQKDKVLNCKKCKHKYGFKDGFPLLLPKVTDDIMLSMKKWDELYQKKLKTKEYLKDMKDFQKLHQRKIVEQLDEESKLNRSDVYLEIGCGPGYIGLHYGKKGVIVVGIDFSTGGLKIARKLADQHKIKNRLFVCGDITQMPFSDNTINLIYGGGVIEHFRDTQTVVDEIIRILKTGGVSFNTVPCLNLGTLYRFRWGNIPNIPVVRQLFEFVNLKLLQGKHMVFGYELSFLRSTLRKLHEKAGFKKVSVGRFDTYLLFESVPSWSKALFSYLCTRLELFWPMYKVVAKK